MYALAGPINTFRTVDKVTLSDVVGDQVEDADFVSKVSAEETEEASAKDQSTDDIKEPKDEKTSN